MGVGGGKMVLISCAQEFYTPLVLGREGVKVSVAIFPPAAVVYKILSPNKGYTVLAAGAEVPRMQQPTSTEVYKIQSPTFRRRTNVQQLTCKIDLSNSFYYHFFSFVLLELKPFVFKWKVPGEKF